MYTYGVVLMNNGGSQLQFTISIMDLQDLLQVAKIVDASI